MLVFTYGFKMTYTPNMIGHLYTHRPKRSSKNQKGTAVITIAVERRVILPTFVDATVQVNDRSFTCHLSYDWRLARACDRRKR